MFECNLSGVNWLVCLTSWKQINKCTEEICLYHYEILCDKMETPTKGKMTFTLDLKINKQHINIHSLYTDFM